jgi:hypothetical protein
MAPLELDALSGVFQLHVGGGSTLRYPCHDLCSHVLETPCAGHFGGDKQAKEGRKKEKPDSFFRTSPLELSALRRCLRLKIRIIFLRFTLAG